MRRVFDRKNVLNEAGIVKAIENFDTEGTLLVKGKRNVIRIFRIGDTDINVKAFRVPGLFNRFIYRYIRKSKAQRSFEYANILLENGIGTPAPIAFFENREITGLKDSYYICEHLNADLTFKELVAFPDYPGHENILRQFTQFSFLLHERGIDFKDHSPGNTLIKKTSEGNYEFFLVDLNRMDFMKEMDFVQRMSNLRKLTPKKEMIAVISNEYAKLYNRPEVEIFEKLWHLTSEFQKGFARKKQLKKKFLFWK